MPTPADDLDPLAPAADALAEQQRRNQGADPVTTGLDLIAEVGNAAGTVVDGAVSAVELAGSAAGAVAEAGGTAVEVGGAVLGGVAEAASGCSCAVVLFLLVGLSAGAATAAAFVR